MSLPFQTFRLQPPHAPLLRHCFGSGQAWPNDSLGSRSSSVLRTSFIASSLISRIRPYRVCVAALVWATVLRTICSLPVALHFASRRRSYFQLLAFSSAREGLSPSYALSLSSARARPSWPQQVRQLERYRNILSASSVQRAAARMAALRRRRSVRGLKLCGSQSGHALEQLPSAL